MRAPRVRYAALEVRQPVCDGDTEACRRRVVFAVQVFEHVHKITARGAHIAGAEVRGHELVVARRNDDFDVVIHDLRDAVEEVLLPGPGAADGPGVSPPSGSTSS